jgi:hypothetical protein
VLYNATAQPTTCLTLLPVGRMRQQVIQRHQGLQQYWPTKPVDDLPPQACQLAWNTRARCAF